MIEADPGRSQPLGSAPAELCELTARPDGIADNALPPSLTGQLHLTAGEGDAKRKAFGDSPCLFLQGCSRRRRHHFHRSSIARSEATFERGRADHRRQLDVRRKRPALVAATGPMTDDQKACSRSDCWTQSSIAPLKTGPIKGSWRTRS